MTNYVVLRKTSGLSDAEGKGTPETWVQTGPTVESVSAEAAIRKAVDGGKESPAAGPDLPSGTYVAVPLRSWAPVTVTVETKRTLRLA